MHYSGHNENGRNNGRTYGHDNNGHNNNKGNDKHNHWHNQNGRNSGHNNGRNIIVIELVINSLASRRWPLCTNPCVNLRTNLCMNLIYI